MVSVQRPWIQYNWLLISRASQIQANLIAVGADQYVQIATIDHGDRCRRMEVQNEKNMERGEHERNGWLAGCVCASAIFQLYINNDLSAVSNVKHQN